MEIRPVIASYSGASYRAIRAFLSDEVLRLITRVAQSPVPAVELDRRVLDELVAMHVLREQEGTIRLDTSVFTADDIVRINATVTRFGRDLAAALADSVAALRNEPPAVTTFVVGVLGVQQSLGEVVRESGLGVHWASFGGKYARSKVDFHEVCDAQEALGPDLLNKNVLRGARYTAVFIGPGGRGYPLRPDAAGEAPGMVDYVGSLNAYLTDAYAMLLCGELDSPALRAAAERAGLLHDGTPEAPVLSPGAMARYEPTMHAVSRITASYFADRVGAMRALLESTTGGRQGVPPENMMLNLWRYLRRAIAAALYAEGILNDRLPEAGLTTVFYSNDVAMLARLLG